MIQKCDAALKRAEYYFGLSGLDAPFVYLPGATRSLRFTLAPGFHIPRLRRSASFMTSAAAWSNATAEANEPLTRLLVMLR